MLADSVQRGREFLDNMRPAAGTVVAMHPNATLRDLEAVPTLSHSPDAENATLSDFAHETDADTQAEESTPAGFKVDDKGVSYIDDDGDAHWVCSKLLVSALVRDRGQGNWGRLLEFADPDGKPHIWAMPMELLRGSGDDLRGELLRQGLLIAPGFKARNKLAEYISVSKPKTRARCVDKTGWYDRVFVFPDRTVGSGRERVIYQSEIVHKIYAQAGSLEQWRQHVAALCPRNSRLTLAVSMGFAAPLLGLTGQESGGVNLVGDSSTGKTTVLRVSASVFGGPDYMHRWRATTNGLEAVAASHNDTLLPLDELAQVDPREAGEIAYLLANGSGKARASRSGAARRPATWRLLFLSAGEIGLAQHMRDGGKTVKAGQEVRLVEIPADAGAGFGVFEDLHGYDSGAALSKAITDGASRFYGTQSIAFLEGIVRKADELRDWLRNGCAKFVQHHLPAGANGQAHRVCERLALIGLAGELATAEGITGWPQEEALWAAATCFQAWLDRRGSAGNLETTNILSAVRAFFEQHGEARFTDLDSGNARDTINRAGFRRKSGQQIEFLVLPETFNRELCAGYEPRAVTRVLVEAGWLVPDAEGKSSVRETLPGIGRARVYLMKSTMWDDKGGADAS